MILLQENQEILLALGTYIYHCFEKRDKRAKCITTNDQAVDVKSCNLIIHLFSHNVIKLLLHVCFMFVMSICFVCVYVLWSFFQSYECIFFIPARVLDW